MTTSTLKLKKEGPSPTLRLRLSVSTQDDNVNVKKKGGSVNGAALKVPPLRNGREGSGGESFEQRELANHHLAAGLKAHHIHPTW